MKSASSFKTRGTTRTVLLCLLVAVFFAWLSPPAMSMDRDGWVKNQIGSKIPEKMDEHPWTDDRSVGEGELRVPTYRPVLDILLGMFFPYEISHVDTASAFLWAADASSAPASHFVVGLGF